MSVDKLLTDFDWKITSTKIN